MTIIQNHQQPQRISMLGIETAILCSVHASFQLLFGGTDSESAASWSSKITAEPVCQVFNRRVVKVGGQLAFTPKMSSMLLAARKAVCS
jgi:hypothetical protein